MTDNEGNELPENPVTALLEAVTQIHELFKSMTQSGFTEWQACRIIGVMFAEEGRQS